jgi:sulfide:quinone oxidoreductase
VAKLHAVHHRAKILIAGGGVAGLETMMALRSLLGGTVEIELLAPDPEFHYRPITVAEPFGLGEARQLELARIAADHDVHLRAAALTSVEASAGVALTDGRERLEYDFMVVAIGARQSPAIEGALTFGGSDDRDALEGVISGVRDGKLKRLVFAAPDATAWLLPLYELALFTAAWAREHQISDLELTLVTHEIRPLEAFGATAGVAVAELLAESTVGFVMNRVARRFDGRHLLMESGRGVAADAVISLPRLEGPRVEGLPHDERGFIPVDRHCAVDGVRRVYAAGDGTAFPIKQGGLAAQQADAAAATIAAELGAIEHAEPFHPVLRGLLLTGTEPRYLRAASSAGAGGELSEVSFQPLWWPPGKIAGRHLTPYLSGPDGLALTRSPLTDRPAPEEPEGAERAGAEEREAIDLLLELADANARTGSFDFALKCLDAAEDVGGPLPEQRQADRRRWAQQRAR